MSELSSEYSLQDRVALVTHESTAQGQAISKALAAAGARVLALGALENDTQLSHLDKIQRAIASVGRLDILVITYLIPPPTPAESLPPADFKNNISTNLSDPFFWSQAAAMQMSQQTPAGGCIIHLSSVGGVLGLPGQSAFCAAMAGVDALIQTLAVEWRPLDIRVVGVSGGLVPQLAENGTLKTVLPDGTTPGHFRIPEQTRTTETDVARVVTFLASAAGQHINGTTVHADGGWLADGYWE